MFNLNLANPEKSEIKYNVSSFPDGQHSITITGIFLHDLNEPMLSKGLTSPLFAFEPKSAVAENCPFVNP